jgi:hypothetical protein
MTRPTGRHRRHYVTDRDIARIKAMALSLSDDYQPPVLDDLDAPVRVGVCRPGEEAYTGAHIAVPWRGRIILGWKLGTRAREARRRQGRYRW